MKKLLLDDALKISISKLENHPQYENYIHFSFLVQDNKIMSVGRNNNGIPAIHYGYHKRVPTPKIHSEVDAYRKARGILHRGGFGLINVRLSKFGELKMSKPCSCCYELLSALGCREFYYSSEIGFLNIKS